MKISTIGAVLLSGCIASANPLIARQDTTSSSSVSSTSTISSASSSDTASITSTSATATTPTTEAVSSTSSSSSSAAAPTTTDTPTGAAQCTEQQATDLHASGNYTGPVALCGLSGGNNTVFVGDNQLITWWAGAFNTSSTDALVFLYLRYMDGTTNNEWNASSIPAYIGFHEIDFTSDFLNGGSSSQFRLILEEREPGRDAVSIQGPVIHILQKDNSLPGPPHNSISLLGVAIGLPVAVVFVAIILCAMWCAMRKNKSFLSRIRLPIGRRKGYGVRQSRRQRAGGATDDFDFDASAPIYRDEPAGDYGNSTREERSARAMGVFTSDRTLASTY